MQHTEIPHELDNRKISLSDDENKDRILECGDKVIYAAIRRYMNNDSRECYPSIRKIKDKTKCSQARVCNAIDRLIKCGFIEKNQKQAPNGKISNYYYFPKSEFDKHFEMFTDDFLDLDIPINIKEYYMDVQQYLYDKESGIGKCALNNTALAKKLGISTASVKKYNTYLIEHGYLQEEVSNICDESGLPVVQKNFNLSGLNQAALWVKAVTQQITTNTQDIEMLKNKVQALERELALQRNATHETPEYTF